MCISKINYSISIIQYFLNLLYKVIVPVFFINLIPIITSQRLIIYLYLCQFINKNPFKIMKHELVFCLFQTMHTGPLHSNYWIFGILFSFCLFNYIIVVMTFPQKASKDDATPNQKQGKNSENTCKLDIHCKI